MLDQASAGPACCGRKTDRLFVRVDFTSRRSKRPWRVIVQDACRRCSVHQIRALDPKRTAWPRQIADALSSGAISESNGLAAYPE